MADADERHVDQVFEAASRLGCAAAQLPPPLPPPGGPSAPAPFQPLRPPHPSRNGSLCKDSEAEAAERVGGSPTSWGSLFCSLCATFLLLCQRCMEREGREITGDWGGEKGFEIEEVGGVMEMCGWGSGEGLRA